MGENTFFNLNGFKISKDKLTSKSIDLSELNDKLKKKLSIFDANNSSSIDTQEELNSFWEGLISASKMNPDGDPNELEIDEIKAFLAQEGVEESEAKNFAEFIMGLVREEKIIKENEDGSVTELRREGNKIIETRTDEAGVLECVYNSNSFDNLSPENIETSTYIADGIKYEVKYGKDNNDNIFTVTFLANNDFAWKLAEKIETLKNNNQRPSNQAIANTCQEIEKLNGKNKNYVVAGSVKLPGFYLANDPLITGQGTREAAKTNYEKNTRKFYQERDERKNNIQAYQNNESSTYEDLARQLYAIEGIKVEHKLQIELRAQELKELNNDIKNGELRGKKLKITLTPNTNIEDLTSHENIMNNKFTFENVGNLIKYCENRGIDCGDIRDLLTTVEGKNFNEEIQNKYLEYFTKKLKTRLRKNDNPPETLPKTKFCNPPKFQQNDLNDCWFLSTVGKLSEDSVNIEKLRALVSTDNDNNPTMVYVNLPSFKTPYAIPIERLQKANEFSSGDLWVRALEMAAEKLLIERSSSVDILKTGAAETIKSPFDGGTMRYACAILFEKDVTPTDYLDKSLMEQMYASLCYKTEMTHVVNALFDNIGLKDYKKSDAYEYYHKPETIKKALAEHKLVAAITSDLVNRDGQSGNHVCFVSKVDSDGTIFVRDPQGGTREYTPEEFAKKFPLIEITSSEKEPEVKFNKTIASLINKVPTHFTAGDGISSIKEIFDIIDSVDDSVRTGIIILKQIVNEPEAREELRQVITLELQKQEGINSDLKAVIIENLTDPKVVNELNYATYKLVKHILKEEKLSPEYILDIISNLNLVESAVQNKSTQRLIFHETSKIVYDNCPENLRGVNDYLYENFTKPIVKRIKDI